MKTGLLKRKVRTAQKVLRQDGVPGLAHVALNKLDRPLLRAKIRYVNPARGRTTPTTVQIECSSNCNLRCPSCSLSREVNPGRHISPDDLRTILDRLHFQPKTVSLNGIGEPLINPNFLTLVDILAERGMGCTFFTNGTLLTARLTEQILSRGNVSFVGISCDGAQKETFERLRFGAKFETWKGFVKNFLNLAHGRSPRPVETVMSSVVSKGNLSELKGIVELAAELGFRSVQFADLVPNDPVAAALQMADIQWSTLDTPSITRRGEELGVDVVWALRRREIPPRTPLRCLQPWEYVMLSVEGDILPCCAIVGSDKADVMGNLFEQDFAQIWQGEKFERFRRTSADGSNPLCRMCPYY
jgi:radical SAM protein with 4Fe4S-binding SPASM domain